MKNIFTLTATLCFIAFFLSQNVNGQETDSTFTDSRDGITYKTVTIGSQTWMAENLAYLPVVNSLTQVSRNEKYYYVNGYNGEDVEEAKATDNFTTYGVLYNWLAAKEACPEGWRLPGDDDWTQLSDNIDNDAKALAARENWLTSTNSGVVGNDLTQNNNSGFSAQPGGYMYSLGNFTGEFRMLQEYGYWWSNTEVTSYEAWNRNIYYKAIGVLRGRSYIDNALSIRCVKEGQTSAVTLPSVNTSEAASITQTSATTGGNVTVDGGADVTSRGVCWSTSQNPTIEDHTTEDGTGTGEFSSNLIGLSSNTTYYARAYATNSEGTAYGNEIKFTTKTEAASQEGISLDKDLWKYYDSDNSEMFIGSIHEFAEDSEQNVWGVGSSMLIKFTPDGHMVKYDADDAGTEGLAIENDNTFWTYNYIVGLSSFDLQTESWTHYNEDNSDLPTNYIYDLVVDNQGNKWIATNGQGLVKFDGSEWIIFNTENSEIPENTIFSLFVDHNNHLWLGMNNSLAKFDGSSWQKWDYSNTENGQLSNIKGIHISNNGDIWIGSTWNLGVSISNIADLSTWANFNYGNSEIEGGEVVDITGDSVGLTVFAMRPGAAAGLTTYKGTEWIHYSADDDFWEASNSDVYAVFIDSNKNLWIGNGGNGFMVVGTWSYVKTNADALTAQPEPFAFTYRNSVFINHINKGAEVSVFNINGQKVSEKVFHHNVTTPELLHQLTNGIYVIAIKDIKTTKSIKIIIN